MSWLHPLDRALLGRTWDAIAGAFSFALTAAWAYQAGITGMGLVACLVIGPLLYIAAWEVACWSKDWLNGRWHARRACERARLEAASPDHSGVHQIPTAEDPTISMTMRAPTGLN